MELVLATRNPHKTREFRELLGAAIELRDLSAFADVTMPEETGGTFHENAILKAVTISKGRDMQNRLIVADDSGLEVDVLFGRPGIYSARYAGENATDAANIEKLLSELRERNIPFEKRDARFRCVIALAQNAKLACTFTGTVEGMIVDPPQGNSGFGYDSVFQPDGFDQTFGEMTGELKNKISHRAKAVTMLRDALADLEGQRGG